MRNLIPPTVIWGLAQDILVTLSGVFCVAMPGRVLELFQGTLQGGSGMSLRAAGMQYGSTEDEKRKDKGLALKMIGFADYWSAFVSTFVSQLLIFCCGVWMVGDELFFSCAAPYLSKSKCLSAELREWISWTLAEACRLLQIEHPHYFFCSIGFQESRCPS